MHLKVIIARPAELGGNSGQY